MASISPVRDKHNIITGYRARACIGRDERNVQIWRTTTIKRPEGLTPAKERREIEQQANVWEKEQREDYKQNHIKQDKSKITFEAFVREHWLRDHVNDGTHTPSSIRFYSIMAEDTIQYFGHFKIAEIDAESIKRWIKYLNTTVKTDAGNPLSPTSVQHRFSTLRNILRYAARFDYIPADPTFKLAQREKPHRAKQDISFLDKEHAQRFMSCLEKEPLYLRCMLSIMIQTGLRRGEIVGLQWRDIDNKTLLLTVERNVTLDSNSPDKIHIGAPKTGECRTVPVTASLAALLNQLKIEQEGKFHATLLPTAFIFCSTHNPYKSLYPTTPTRYVSQFVRKNGLPNVSPHDLRHTAATLALESGANLKQVQTLLGHRDASTTLRFYAGVSETAQRATVEGIENLLNATDK